MEIELDDYENGTPIVVQTTKDVADKVKELKGRKDYNEIYQLTKGLPNNKTKYLIEANALMHLRKWKQLASCCEYGLQVQECADLYNLKGKAVGKLGNYQQKLQLTLKAIQISPKVAAYHRNAGAAYYKLKDFNNAIKQHDIAIKIQPKNSINYHNKGAALFRLKQYNIAKQCFQQAIKLDHKQVISHSWLGDCQFQLSNYRQAKAHYRQAYEISGNDIYKKQIQKVQQKLNPQGKKGIKGFFSRLLS